MDIIKEYVDRFNAEDNEHVINKIDNAHAYEWMKEEIPVFECPDKDIERAYYFRFWTFRKHIREEKIGYMISEFLPKVGWSGEYNEINAAVGHHLYEGRWLKNAGKYFKSYINHFLDDSYRGHLYSSWMLWAMLEYSKVTGDYDWGEGYLAKICKHYEEWEAEHLLKNGFFWSLDDNDAMELSISSRRNGKLARAIRPTLNSYMCANAYAIAEFAKAAGEMELCEKYIKKHEALKNLINDQIWYDGFYRAFPYFRDIDVPEDAIKNYDGQSPMELIGYIPWMFNIPPKGREDRFELLEDEGVFLTPYGLATADKSDPRFLYYDEHECQWNGYVWPFATAQTLTALYTQMKRDEDSHQRFGGMYYRLLKQYAWSHHLTREDGTMVSWIDESRSPLEDDWYSRSRLIEMNWKGGKEERGKDYNHSTYCDLVISGLVGFGVEDGCVKVKPCFPEEWDWCRLTDIPCMGKLYTVTYDKTGEKFGGEKGLTVTCR